MYIFKSISIEDGKPGMIPVKSIPENCRDCEYFGMYCRLTGTRLYYNEDGRVDDCPIVPIEKQG